MAIAAGLAMMALSAPTRAVGQVDRPELADSLTASAETVGFDPPADQDLHLTISDRRPLANGNVVRFTVRNRLRFTRGAGGMIATLRRDGADCVGSASVCAMFERAMAPWMGTIQRFAIARDGRVTTLVEADLSSVGEGVPQAAEVLSAIEAERPGALGMAEMREALGYVGQRVDVPSLTEAAIITPDELVIARPDREHVEINSVTRLEIESG